jgi:type 1 glutamine amidotransferase
MMWTDEYYEYKDGKRKPNFNYLLTVDERTYDINAQWGPDNKAVGHGDFHPMSWYHEYDGGRAWYTNLGHVPAVFEDPNFLTHLYGGIYWAAKGMK